MKKFLKQTISGIFSPLFSRCSNALNIERPQGPAPIITCSQSIVPWFVSTPVTALLLLPLLKPLTFTPLITQSLLFWSFLVATFLPMLILKIRKV